MAILTEQRERRDAQPVPTEAVCAAEKFTCGVYRCVLSGTACRDYHAQSKITRSMSREACIDCPAGAARLALLGDGDTPGLAAICLERTAKGLACTNPPIKNGYCHIHRKDRIQMPQPQKKAPAAKQAARSDRATTTRPAPATRPPVKKAPRGPLVVDVPVDVEIEVSVEAVAPPAPVKIDMQIAKPEQPSAALCRRPDCGRPAYEGGRLSDYCRQCGNSAYVTLKKGLGRMPSDEERRAWLVATPISRHLREALAKSRRGDQAVAVVAEPATPPAAQPAPPEEIPQETAEAAPVAVVVEDVGAAGRTRTPPPGAKGIDWDGQPLGRVSDTALGETLGCSATAVRFQRQRRGIPPFTPSPSKSTTFVGKKRMPRHKARLAIGEYLCKTLKVKQPPHFDLVESGTAEWAFCILPERDTFSHLHPDGRIVFRGTAWVPGSDAAPTAPTVDTVTVEDVPQGPPLVFEDGPAPLPTAPTTAAAGMPPRLRDETPSHSLLVLKINTRAYAELERLAREGLDGDDPADVARTLLLEGLRRRAVVRP